MGRRNRKPEPVWSPQSAARIRAGLVYGHHEDYRHWTTLGTELDNVIDSLSAELDDVEAGILSVSPEEAQELEDGIDETTELVGELEMSESLSLIAAKVAATSPVYWVADSALATLREESDVANDVTSVLALQESGIVVFESPVGRLEIAGDADTDEVDGSDSLIVDVDGIFWFHTEFDDEDDDDDPATAVWFHVLSRMPDNRNHLMDGWRLPVVADVETVAFRSDDVEVPVLPPGVELVLRLGMSVSTPDSDVTMQHEALPKSKQIYDKRGWPDVPPLESVVMVVADQR
ncbi:hypothetical protein AAFP30_20430 [Gordonia sp. CPCC 205515]|uniref:hypothetical protein n=1 Tax=Gordonia sp. CPCC 205515 TaxID=3140791 RepID=UPI003AF35D92